MYLKGNICIAYINCRKKSDKSLLINYFKTTKALFIKVDMFKPK